MRQVIIEVNADGTSKVEAEGFVGSSCKDTTAALEHALTGGAGTANTDEKPEYFQVIDGSVDA